jgi:hypothetical protein
MKNRFVSKICWLFLVTILLFSSCLRFQCEEFNRQSETLTIVFFPEDLSTYEFAKTDDPNEVIRLLRVRYDFSEEYNIRDSDDYDCYSTHTTRYSSLELPFFLGNDLSYGYFGADPIDATIRFLALNAGDQIIGGRTYELPPDNPRILRDINNLVQEQIMVNGETFNDVLQINMNSLETTLFVERNQGLQGILINGELYRRIN